MNQQDAKNLITLDEFLDSLQGIISSFKTYVEITNKRIDELSKRIDELSNRVNENTSISRQLKKDNTNKLDEIDRTVKQLDGNSGDLNKVLKALADTIKVIDDDVKSIKEVKAKTSPGKKAQSKIKNSAKKPGK